MVAERSPRVEAPGVAQKAADLAPHVEPVAPRVWWVPSWSGTADEAGDAFHVVSAHKGPNDGWVFVCDCPAAAHSKSCSHVEAVKLWGRRRQERRPAREGG